MKNLDLLVPQPPEPRDEFRFGTVTQANPLMVRFDGDTTPTPVATALEPVRTGERVMVLAKRQQRILTGVVGGPTFNNSKRAYHFNAGLLITTNILAVESSMWMLETRINSYTHADDGAGVIWWQGFSRPDINVIRDTAGTSTVGPRTLHAFILGGVLCFWLSGTYSYETAFVSLWNQDAPATHRIVSVVEAGLPTVGVSRAAAITARTLGDVSGWQDVPLADGVTGTCQVNVEDRTVHLRGSNLIRSGGWPQGLFTIGTLPAGSRPTGPVALSVLAQFPATVGLRALQDGQLQFLSSSAVAASAIVVGGSFRND